MITALPFVNLTLGVASLAIAFTPGLGGTWFALLLQGSMLVTQAALFVVYWQIRGQR